MVYGDFAYVDERRRGDRQFAVPETLDREQAADARARLFSGAALFRRSLFERFGGLDTEPADGDGLRPLPADRPARRAPSTAAPPSPTSAGTAAAPRARSAGGWSARTTGSAAATAATPRTAPRAHPLNDVKRVVDVSSLPLRKARAARCALAAGRPSSGCSTTRRSWAAPRSSPCGWRDSGRRRISVRGSSARRAASWPRRSAPRGSTRLRARSRRSAPRAPALARSSAARSGRCSATGAGRDRRRQHRAGPGICAAAAR